MIHKQIERALLVVTGFLCFSCQTIRDMEEVNVIDAPYKMSEDEEREEIEKNEKEMKELFMTEELKRQDVENTVVFVDRPVYVPADGGARELERGNKVGYEAVKESLTRSTIKPQQYDKGTFFYQYNENLVYEVYAQPFHLTDVILEPGEIVTAPPLMSEDESVWELTAGVGKDPATGEDVQHLFIKPAYSKLDSSLVIITDRRVYHFRIKSFSDTHMAMVKFVYPASRNQWLKKIGAAVSEAETDYIRVTNPELLSFDYVVKYSMRRPPEFLPTRVYDDGQSTFIQVNEIVLQKQLPVLFNDKDEIVNYSVKKNVFIIPRLITKATLRLGKEKVIIEKKKTKRAEVNIAE